METIAVLCRRYHSEPLDWLVIFYIIYSENLTHNLSIANNYQTWKKSNKILTVKYQASKILRSISWNLYDCLSRNMVFWTKVHSHLWLFPEQDFCHLASDYCLCWHHMQYCQRQCSIRLLEQWQLIQPFSFDLAFKGCRSIPHIKSSTTFHWSKHNFHIVSSCYGASK